MDNGHVVACITPKNKWVIGALSFEEYVLSVDKNIEELVGPGFEMPNANYGKFWDQNRDPRNVARQLVEEL